MVALVTPQYVRELASLLDVNAAHEWALAFALASAPLPEGWTCMVADDKSASFVHDARPESPQREHPLLEKALLVLAQMRTSATAGGSGDSSSGSEPRLLGPFENLDSPAVEYFFMNIQTGEEVPEFESPPSAVIPPLQQGIRQLLTANGPFSVTISSQKGQEQEPERERKQHGEEGGQSRAIGQDLGNQDQQGSRPDSAVSRADADAVQQPNAEAGGTGAEAEPAAGAAERGEGQLGSGGSSAAGPLVDTTASYDRAGSGTDAAEAAEAPLEPAEDQRPGGPSDSRRNRTQSSSSSSSSSSAERRYGGAAGGAALGSHSTGTGSLQAAKPPSREGSGRSVGSGPGMTNGRPPPDAAAATARSAATAFSSRPTSAASSPSSMAPAPPPALLATRPNVATVAANNSSQSLGRIGSSGYGEEDDVVGYRRDGGTTAGYAGSASESGAGTSGGGGVGGGGRNGAGSGGSSSSVHGSSSGGSVPGGGGGHVSVNGGAGEPLSRSGSSRSTASGRSGDTGDRNGRGSISSGGGGGGVGVRPPVPPPSGRLTFYGWWFEDIESPDLTFRIDTNPTAGGGLAARHCILVYDFASSSYNFTMRDPVTPPAPGQPYERIPELTVPGIDGEHVAMCDTGRPADLWDLHLGARLRVLGRQVVLKNSDLATAQWHAGYFRQLCALRDKLHQEVQKYKPRVLRPGLVADKGDVRLQTGQQLRHVALQVRELIEDLRQYRPRKAESFIAALPVQF